MESSSHRTRKRVGAVGGAPSSGSNWVNPSPSSAALQALSSMRPSMRSGPDRRAALILRKKLAAPAGDGPVCGGAASAGPETTARASSGRSMRRSTSVEPNGGPLPGISPPRCGRAAFWYTAGVAEPVQVVSETPSTPMLRQYQEAKAQAKDALLFFRLGDFYELFYDDARVAAQLLGITLTSRAKGDDRVPMAGVPHHAAKGYVARLVAAGYKVARCDQVEVPGPGKQLVRREIVRLVTPGTVFEEEDAREPVWLGAVALEGERAAVALLDASTGELRALQPGGVESALDELQRAQPRELLLPEELLGTPLEEALKKASGAVRIEGRAPRGPAEAQRFLQRHLGVATLDGFGLREPLSVQAAAEALSYLQETQRSAAQHVVRVQVEQPAQALWIDPSAVRNLELFRGPDGRRTGTLLSVVDRTLTAAGSRMLSRWLSAPLADAFAIGARQDAVEELSQAAVAREEISDALRGVLDVERLLGRLAVGQGAPRDLAGLRASLQRMPALAKRLEACSAPRLRDLAPPLGAPADLCAFLDRALADEIPAGREPGFVRQGYRSDLDELADLAQGGRAAIAALEAQERARTGIQSLKVRYNRVTGFYIEVTKPNLHLVPGDYQRRSSTVGAERFIMPALAEHEARVLSAEERRAALEQQIFDELRTAVLARSADLRACAAAAPRGRARARRVRGRPLRAQRPVARLRAAAGGAHRSQHGGQEHGDAPGRADRGARAGGLLRSGAARPHRAGGSALHPRGRSGRSGPRPEHLHGRDGGVRAHPSPGHAALAAAPGRGGARDQHLRRARPGVGDRRAPARRGALADPVRDPLPRAVRPGPREAARGKSHDGGLRRRRPRRLPAQGRAGRRVAQLRHPRRPARRAAGRGAAARAGDPRQPRGAGAGRGRASGARLGAAWVARPARLVRRGSAASGRDGTGARAGGSGRGAGRRGAARARPGAHQPAGRSALAPRAAEEAALSDRHRCRCSDTTERIVRPPR